MNHATPILVRLRNVFGQQRLPAVSATAHDAHEPRHESSSLERNSLVLEITGMTCAGCASHVEKALLSAPGVHKADVSYAEGTARVSGEGAFDPAALSAAVHAAGYGVVLEKSAHAGGLPQRRRYAPPRVAQGSRSSRVVRSAALASTWVACPQRS